MNWEKPLLHAVQEAVAEDSFWAARLQEVFTAGKLVHLAVFVEPYLQFVLTGRKTVESRFSKNSMPPYKRVGAGDIVLLKRSGGHVVGIGLIANVWSYQLSPSSWKSIRHEFAEMLCAQDPAFWEQRKSASFATLMTLKHVQSFEPIECKKKDRRGWVVLENHKRSHGLFGEMT